MRKHIFVQFENVFSFLSVQKRSSLYSVIIKSSVSLEDHLLETLYMGFITGVVWWFMNNGHKLAI